MTIKTAVVLLSGGQDSVTCLYWALANFDTVYAVSVNYGQRHSSELAAAAKIAAKAGVQHTVLELPALAQIADSDLVRKDTAIAGSGGHPDKEMPEGLPTSFVPGRNLLFLGLASAYAVKMGAGNVITGVCQTDYSGYPDCRDEFVKALNVAVNLAMPSSRPVAIHTPLMYLTKAETVELAKSLGTECLAALGESITCYNGLRPGCGTCPACTLRAAGFAEAGVPDPSALQA